MTGGLLSALFSGMWHGYRRWMTLFNSLSIVLSVTLAMVILGFTHGVRRYVEDTVRKEAAAGAVRIHAGGWQVEGADESFAERVRRADAAFTGQGHAGPERSAETGDYQGFNFWSRSEAHYLMPRHPSESDLGGVFVKMGNTRPADPEAERVAPYAVAGRWIEDPEAPEIVLDQTAAIKLAKRIEEISSVEELLGREIWIALPPTAQHLPGACARVEVVGIFHHLRDGACMTTSRVIQDMHARTRANAYGKWYETYDRMAYRVLVFRAAGDAGRPGLNGGAMAPRPRQASPSHSGSSVSPGGRSSPEPPSSGLDEVNERIEMSDGVPLLCWRSRDDRARWFNVRGRIAQRGETEGTRELRSQAAEARKLLEVATANRAEESTALEEIDLLLQGSEETRQWLEELQSASSEAFADAPAPASMARLDEMVRTAAEQLQLAFDVSTVTSPDTFAVFFDAVMGRIESTRSSLMLKRGALEKRSEELRAEAQILNEEISVLTEEADAMASASILSTGGAFVVEAETGGGETTVSATVPLRATVPDSEHSDLDALDARYPDGYVLCSPRIWDELGFAAAPLLPVDDWREHALYAYFYFDGLRPALAAREQLKQWGFETYMPIDRFKGLLALVRVVTWAAVALLAAVLLAGLLGIVVTLYTEVDAEEAEIGLLKALGASNRLVGLVFLCKGALVGLIGVVLGVPLAALVVGRINAGVSGAVARAAGLAEVEAGLFSQDPRLVWALGVLIVALAALAALLPALQAAGKDPQEALRAE